MKRYIQISLLSFFCASLLPFGALANTDDVKQKIITSHKIYDHSRQETYKIDGRSMETLGFHDKELIDVVPATQFYIGDIIAFTCTHDECDSAYIKKITRKNKNCYWVEGREDIWTEDGVRKESKDSSSAFGWLCGDEITIIGEAFHKKV